jgi:hypothetical protein
MRLTKAGAGGGVLLALMACPALSWAQPGPAKSPPPLTFKSLGQPPLFKPYVAGSLTWNREGEERLGGVGIAGLYKDLVLPISGLGVGRAAWAGSARAKGGGWDGRARLFPPAKCSSQRRSTGTARGGGILPRLPPCSNRESLRPGAYAGGSRAGNSFSYGLQIRSSPWAGAARNGLPTPKPPSGARRGRAHGRDPAQLRRSATQALARLHPNFFNDGDGTDLRGVEVPGDVGRTVLGRPTTRRGIIPESGTTTRPSTPLRVAVGRNPRRWTGRPRPIDGAAAVRPLIGRFKSPTLAGSPETQAGWHSAVPSAPRPRPRQEARSACSTRSRGCSTGPASS